MSVTFKLTTSVEMHIPVNNVRSSKFIDDLLLMFSVTDIVIDVPDKYNDVFNIYFDFLAGKYISEQIRCKFDNDINYLLLCFNMESYFNDSIFFKYLIKQSHYVWDKFYKHIDTLPDPQMVYLYSPYEYVPGIYMNKSCFFNEWLIINQRGPVLINGNKQCHMVYTFYDTDQSGNKRLTCLNVNHTEESRIRGYGLEKRWYMSGDIKSINTYFDDKEHGLQQKWYTNSNVNFRYYSTHGQKHGSYDAWHENGSPRISEHYVMGKSHGPKLGWYANDSGQNGKIGFKHMYNDDEKDGLQEEWYPNGNIGTRQNFVCGKEHGLQQHYYTNGQLRHQYYTVNGTKHGIEKQWNNAGVFGYRQKYKNDKVCEFNNFPCVCW